MFLPEPNQGSVSAVFDSVLGPPPKSQPSSAHGASALLPDDIKMENYIEVQEALDLWKAQFSEDKEQDLPEDVTVQTMWDQPVF